MPLPLFQWETYRIPPVDESPLHTRNYSLRAVLLSSVLLPPKVPFKTASPPLRLLKRKRRPLGAPFLPPHGSSITPITSRAFSPYTRRADQVQQVERQFTAFDLREPTCGSSPILPATAPGRSCGARVAGRGAAFESCRHPGSDTITVEDGMIRLAVVKWGMSLYDERRHNGIYLSHSRAKR